MDWSRFTGCLALTMLALTQPALGSNHATLIQEVKKAPVHLSVTVSPPNPGAESTVHLSTTVTGVRLGATPTGSVELSLSAPGSAVPKFSSGPLLLNEEGVANWTIDVPTDAYLVNAIYSGDTEYLTNHLSSQIFGADSGSGDFLLDVAPKLTIQRGSSGKLDVVVSSLHGFNDLVQLSCSGLGRGMGCNLNPVSVRAQPTPSTAFLEITTTLTTLGGHNGWALLLGIFLRRRRSYKLCYSRRLILVFLTLIPLALSGCGTSPTPPQEQTPSGVYTIMVTGVSGNLKHSKTVTVTVQ
jgi:hypothetical protein